MYGGLCCVVFYSTLFILYIYIYIFFFFYLFIYFFFFLFFFFFFFTDYLALCSWFID